MPVAIDATTPVPLIGHGSRAARLLAGGMAILLVAIYVLLQNPYWVRHGDSEVFLSLARNIATGGGYRFNGQPVAIVPPGWPLVLAAAMQFSTSLEILKLLPMAATIGFLLVSYHLLLRWTTPLIAALCVLTAAMLEPVFSLSFLFFSDALFSFIVVGAIWTALRISDGADSWPRIVALMVLCVLAVTVRWAGLPFFAVIGAAALHGEFWPRWNRRWIAFALSAMATVATFSALRLALKVDESQLDRRYDSFVSGAYSILSQTSPDDSYVNRIVHFGEWIGGLLWRPAQNYRFSRSLDNAAGWIVSLLLPVPIVEAVKRRQWIGLGGAIYVAALGINWPDPISRYIIPLTPFILFGTYETISILSRHFRMAPWARLLALHAFFASVLAVNGLLYGMNVAVMRSRHFYEAWQGGVHKELIDAANFLRNQPRGQYEIGISGRTVNFGREFPVTDGYRRALHFLTARDIVTIPPELCREPDAELIRWLHTHNVRFYLYQPPIRVVEHFRPRTLDGEALDPDDSAWRLYEIRDGRATRLTLTPIGEWPRDVPLGSSPSR